METAKNLGSCPFDFAKIEALIPEKGHLTVSFTKKDGLIAMLFSPTHTGKEKEQAFRPLSVRGTAEGLAQQWEQLPEIAAKMQEIAAATTLPARKAEITKAAQKSSNAKPTGKTATTAATAKPQAAEKKETVEEKKAVATGTLFDAPAGAEVADKPAEKAEPAPAELPESPEDEDQETTEPEPTEEDEGHE